MSELTLPLSCDPGLRLEPVPALPPALAALLQAERAALEAHPRHFDGSQLMASALDGETIVGYEASYAWYAAWQKAGAGTDFGLGSIGVGLLLDDGDGRTLWQRRSERVLFPGHWIYALGGGVTSGQTPREAVLAEAREELGLEPADLLDLRAVALLHWQELGVYTVFRARLRPGAVLAPEPEEVAELRWVQDPLAELAPVQPLVDRIWLASAFLPASEVAA